MSENQREKTFEQVLLESVDEAISILGESVRASIYFHLEKEFRIARQDIPNKC